MGLSLEESRPRNRDLCLTNKVFVYLLAGIPQLLSHTAAQCVDGVTVETRQHEVHANPYRSRPSDSLDTIDLCVHIQ